MTTGIPEAICAAARLGEGIPLQNILARCDDQFLVDNEPEGASVLDDGVFRSIIHARRIVVSKVDVPLQQQKEWRERIIDGLLSAAVMGRVIPPMPTFREAVQNLRQQIPDVTRIFARLNPFFTWGDWFYLVHEGLSLVVAETPLINEPSEEYLIYGLPCPDLLGINPHDGEGREGFLIFARRVAAVYFEPPTGHEGNNATG